MFLIYGLGFLYKGPREQIKSGKFEDQEGHTKNSSIGELSDPPDDSACQWACVQWCRRARRALAVRSQKPPPQAPPMKAAPTLVFHWERHNV